ncbi:MAG: class I SAM-dependent methyltransferase [Polyangia bacterium]
MTDQSQPSGEPSERRVYDRWHETLDVNAGADDPWYLLVHEQLDLSRDIAGQRILEIGCGRGGFACWLAGRPAPPAEVVAVDYSSAAVEKGRTYAAQRGISRVTWRTGDIQAMDFADGSFDTVVSCETIEHVPDPFRGVQELARVLKPGGRLFLTVPNYFGVYGLYRAYLRLRGRKFTEVGQPINQLTLLPRTLGWVKRAGLRVETIRGKGHYVFWPGQNPKRVHWLDRDPLKWFALHVVIVAAK